MIEKAEFASSWRAERLAQPPLIAPARQFVYPQNIPGEEDALARGALRALVHPAAGGTFLATFALGFTDPRMPTGLYACPEPAELCAAAGGYVYLIDTLQPTQCTLLPLRPVVEIVAAVEHGLLIFAGNTSLAAWRSGSLAWHTARLSWEGLRLTGIAQGKLTGLGWDLHTDRELAFEVDLATGAHSGGAFASAER